MPASRICCSWVAKPKKRNLVGLRIGQGLSRLQYLQVQFCSLTKLDIQAPNLTTFVFDDYMIPIVLGEPLKISEATISLFASSDCFNYVFRDLVNALSHVQSLSISFGLETEVCSLNPGRCLHGLAFILHVVLGSHCMFHVLPFLCYRWQGLWKVQPGSPIWDIWSWRLISLGRQKRLVNFFDWLTFWS